MSLVTLTPVEQWELRARRAAVEVARLHLGIAEAQAQEAINRILSGYGISGACDIHDDGTIHSHDAPAPAASNARDVG